MKNSAMMSFLDLPRKIQQRIIGNLDLNDRESFTLACRAFDVIEKTTDLAFHNIVFTHDPIREKIRFTVVNTYNKTLVFYTEDIENMMKFKHRRTISRIGRLIGAIEDMEGLNLLRSFWEGIRVGQLDLSISPQIFSTNEAFDLLPTLKECADSGEFHALGLYYNGGRDDMMDDLLGFIKQLPDTPLILEWTGWQNEVNWWNQIDLNIIEKLLLKHRQVTFNVLCPKISAKKHMQIFELIAVNYDITLKMSLDFAQISSFLGQLSIRVKMDLIDNGDAGRKMHLAYLTFKVVEDSIGEEAEIFIYHYYPNSFAYFCFFSDTGVQVKIQQKLSHSCASGPLFIVGFEKVPDCSTHWAWRNKANREEINLEVVHWKLETLTNGIRSLF
ncbi:hypothetical protein PENTCL1PPCAC_21942 [Pristionchus entomophagus]|uniref:F-box domain-containing protein n=1 Tax=Pristionchus entomophagus TaxID=358040 RepID=A0AAV5U089_9BILA|nr:hypothetical protein PENTCL1PPCAC_21942 [Pristionchus entomophagus]